MREFASAAFGAFLRLAHERESEDEYYALAVAEVIVCYRTNYDCGLSPSPYLPISRPRPRCSLLSSRRPGPARPSSSVETPARTALAAQVDHLAVGSFIRWLRRWTIQPLGHLSVGCAGGPFSRWVIYPLAAQVDRHFARAAESALAKSSAGVGLVEEVHAALLVLVQLLRHPGDFMRREGSYRRETYERHVAAVLRHRLHRDPKVAPPPRLPEAARLHEGARAAP